MHREAVEDRPRTSHWVVSRVVAKPDHQVSVGAALECVGYAGKEELKAG
jgi:hypothetical protein